MLSTTLNFATLKSRASFGYMSFFYFLSLLIFANIDGGTKICKFNPFKFKNRDFLLFSGRSGKPLRAQKDAKKNNNPPQFSASSSFNFFWVVS